MALDDDFAGGPSYYNPQFGLMAIQQPDMFVQHLASKGIAPPPDFEEGFTHMDAHAAMSKDQSRAPSLPSTAPGQPALPQQGSFEERFSDAQQGAPGSARPYTEPMTGVEIPDLPPRPTPTVDPTTGQPIPLPRSRPAPEPRAEERPLPDIPRAGEIGRSLLGVGKAALGVEGEEPSRHPVVRFFQGKGAFPGTQREFQEQRAIGGGKTGAAAAETPLSPDVPTPRPRPTSAADTPPTTGTGIAAGDTSEPPGGLNKKDPNAKTESEKEKKEDKGDAFDSFGKALAGISSMKTPTPVFPHPGNLPRPSNQISRSTLPTELMKELSQIGHPGQLVRLGAALKGR